MGVVDCEVLDELSGFGMVFFKFGVIEIVNEFCVGDGVFGIIEIVYWVSIISLVWLLESDCDVIFCFGGFLELG